MICNVTENHMLLHSVVSRFLKAYDVGCVVNFFLRQLFIRSSSLGSEGPQSGDLTPIDFFAEDGEANTRDLSLICIANM